LPPDDPVKDFLLDANRRFAQFKAVRPETSILDAYAIDNRGTPCRSRHKPTLEVTAPRPPLNSLKIPKICAIVRE
jgi:hypothetical protein